MKIEMHMLDDSGDSHLAEIQERAGVVLRCQVFRFVCSCGWESEWITNRSMVEREFLEHVEVINYVDKNP